uniref:Uncharacterized protein n=1 Tax=Avena sativa TaxID=4498 RepID=A0ACD5VHK9_AVESA
MEPDKKRALRKPHEERQAIKEGRRSSPSLPLASLPVAFWSGLVHMHASMEMEVAGGNLPHCRDRLSNLPDCLLHAILSQLEARQAVQTCVLSRRWPLLWRAIPCITIDSADFSNQQVCPRTKEEALAKLEDFADNLLLRRAVSLEPPLDALRLCVQAAGPRGDMNMGRWIRRGLKLSPAALEVSGGDGYPINLNFLSSSVSGGGVGRLTRLRIDNVILHRDFEDLLGSGGLPVLQDLEIVNPVIVSAIWRIAADTLTRLAVVDVSCHHQSRCSVHIAAPRLASLRLEFPLARLASVHFSIIDGGARLAQASIRLLEDDGEDPSDNISDVCFLLNSLSSVTRLHLSGFQETKQLLLQEVLDHVSMSWTSMLSFPNLATLVLEDCDLGHNLQTLWRLLQTTPAITRLLLK